MMILKTRMPHTQSTQLPRHKHHSWLLAVALALITAVTRSARRKRRVQSSSNSFRGSQIYYIKTSNNTDKIRKFKPSKGHQIPLNSLSYMLTFKSNFNRLRSKSIKRKGLPAVMSKLRRNRSFRLMNRIRWRIAIYITWQWKKNTYHQMKKRKMLKINLNLKKDKSQRRRKTKRSMV